MANTSLFETRAQLGNTVYSSFACEIKTCKLCQAFWNLKQSDSTSKRRDPVIWVTVCECMILSSDQATVIQLNTCDIPGVFVSKPIECYTMPELRWWLLCKGIKALASWNKKKLLSRLATCKATRRTSRCWWENDSKTAVAPCANFRTQYRHPRQRD